MCLGIIDEFEQDGQADLMEQFARRLPVAAIARLLGLPEHPDLEKWALAFITYQWDPENSLESARAFTGFLREVVEERRRHPGDDMISRLFAAQIDGEALDDETLLTFVRLLFPTGADTTYLGVGSMLYALIKHPEVVDGSARQRRPESQFVEETLRWESPVGAMPRICVEDTTFHDEQIPAGAYVLLGITCANRDPAVFADPDRFDPERDSRRHLTFGLGRHFCLGCPVGPGRDARVAGECSRAVRSPRVAWRAPVRRHPDARSRSSRRRLRCPARARDARDGVASIGTSGRQDLRRRIGLQQLRYSNRRSRPAGR